MAKKSSQSTSPHASPELCITLVANQPGSIEAYPSAWYPGQPFVVRLNFNSASDLNLFYTGNSQYFQYMDNGNNNPQANWPIVAILRVVSIDINDVHIHKVWANFVASEPVPVGGAQPSGTGKGTVFYTDTSNTTWNTGQSNIATQEL